MKKSNGVNYSNTAATKSRRKRVILLLEKQLKSGWKTVEKHEDTPLTPKDVERIKKEIATLKQRV